MAVNLQYHAPYSPHLKIRTITPVRHRVRHRAIPRDAPFIAPENNRPRALQRVAEGRVRGPANRIHVSCQSTRDLNGHLDVLPRFFQIAIPLVVDGVVRWRLEQAEEPLVLVFRVSLDALALDDELAVVRREQGVLRVRLLSAGRCEKEVSVLAKDRG